MSFPLLTILFLTVVLQASAQTNSAKAIVNGSTIPGQGYVYVNDAIGNLTILKEVWIEYPYIAYGLQEIVNVACKMAGYNGTSSPCMHGYYSLDGWKLKQGPSHLKIRACKGTEATLLQCEQTSYTPQPLMVNCLPPEPTHFHGVFFKQWIGKGLLPDKSRWKYAPVFQKQPLLSYILATFDVFKTLWDSSVIKVTAYLMVKRPGEYSIGAACKYGCEVWWTRVQEPGLSDFGKSANMIIKLAATAKPNEYERNPKQNIKMLITCHVYQMEFYARLERHGDFANIALKSESYQSWSPIPTKLLYWDKPGSRELHFSLTNNISSHINLGSKLLIKALYKFCCVGLRCPTCPLTLNLHALEQKILVNSSLQMDCMEYSFNYSIDVIQQPKNYSIEISYYLNGDERWTKKRTVKTIQVSESTFYSCRLLDSRHHSCSADWKVYVQTESSLTPDTSKVNEDYNKSSSCYGTKHLQSPTLPWREAFKNISLCASFSYRLPSQGLSRLDVYLLLKSGNQHKWSIKGYQGASWKNGSISIVRIKEQFKVLFNISSNVNKATCGIQDFRLSSSECKIFPKHAEPGYRCADSQYQCNNGECIDKYKRCDGLKDDCIDGSDETGCACLTGQFRCFDGSCVDASKLCNKKLDCKNEDEMRCGNEPDDCPGFRCIDGRCPTLPSQCEDITYNISECWKFAKYHTNICREKTANCGISRGICGFDTGPCGMENDGWSYNSLTDKIYKRFDHSFKDEGSFYVARPRNNSALASTLSMQWNQTKPYCMQLWYIVPAKSSIKVCHQDIRNSTTCLWSPLATTDHEWNFGQVEIPGDKGGSVQIVGYAKAFLAVDDSNFIATSCSQVISQTNPSCYFDRYQPCQMKIDKSWVPTMHKDRQGENSFYLHFQGNASNMISSPLMRSKSDGWKCLRFWMSSMNKHSSRKLEIFYKNQSNLISIFRFTSLTPGWIFFQSPIPGEENNFQVVIEGKRDEYASLSVDDITYTKFQCQRIPDADAKSNKECLEYSTLDDLDRRKDQSGSKSSFRSKDSEVIEVPFTWYRIAGLAGNQVSTECTQHSKYACNDVSQFWIDGNMPSLAQGPLDTTMCVRIDDECCVKRVSVVIRNCGGYFVYRFINIESGEKVCTEYSARKLTIDMEWRNWSNVNSGLKWGILSDKQFILVEAIQTDQDKHLKGLQRGVGLVLNGTVLFNVPTKPNIESFTMCFWISSNTTTSKLVKITIKTNMEMSLDVFICRSVWRHICVSFQYGVYLIYVDGVVNKTEYTGNELWKLNGADIKLSITSHELINIKLTSLNAWDKFLDEDTILYMSYSCKSHKGTMVLWEEFVKNISMVTSSNSSVVHYNRTSCEGRKGNVLSVVSNASTALSARATYLSPPYPLLPRLVKSPARCLRFQYRLWGPGAKVLKLYQVLDNKTFPWRPIWIEKTSSSSWKEGRVTLSAVTEYQIAIVGEMSNAPGLISIGALYTTEEYCPVLPASADKACNEIFTNLIGNIMSPYYPSYYSNNASCNSTIIAKRGYVIRLDVVEFELEMSTRCENDSVDVYDGGKRTGRYCGIRYPPIIQSTTNQLSVVFRSNAKITRTGFMARYRILRDNDTKQGCLQDCPADCQCRKLSDGRIVVSSRSINAVPRRLPRDTSVMYTHHLMNQQLQYTDTLFSGNKIFHIKRNTFEDLQQLSLIDLSYNRIISMDRKAFVSLPSLHTLRLNMNFIKNIEKETWINIVALQILDVGDNLISSIASGTFSHFQELKALSLRSNLITFLHDDTFQNNSKLTSLYLHGNEIQKIPNGLFRNQKKLRVLYLHNNRLKKFSKSSFRGLTMLEKMLLNNNNIKETEISRDVFSELENLKYLKIDSFILCCYAKKSIPTLTECESESNGFSSCEDMLKSIVIRVGIWVQGLFASFGNLAVIVWWTVLGRKPRSKSTRNKPNVQSLLLRHLALADFLMGIYLLFIAIQDSLWKGEYVDHDVEWRSGISCQIAGAISTLSSEVSVMMLVVMTADRFSTIVFDFKGKRLNLKSAHCVCLLVWITGIFIAFSPMFATSYFNDEKTGFSFYGRSTVCNPFQLSSYQPSGWEYSVAVFMAFNGAAFLFILVAYVAIFIKVQRSAKRVQSSREPSSLGSRIMFIVLTDFCCWMPVIVLGILSLAGKFYDSTGQVYAVIAVFVLPVNSSINPIIYTFATPQAQKLYQQMTQGLRDKFQGWKPKRTEGADLDNAGYTEENEHGIELKEVKADIAD